MVNDDDRRLANLLAHLCFRLRLLGLSGGVEVIKRPGGQIALKTNGFSMILIDFQRLGVSAGPGPWLGLL
jgi:hypothetical protein